MLFKYPLNILCCGLLLSTSADAQSDRLYHLSPDKVKVFDANGVQMSMPWAGGMNNAQFAVADLNNDGRKDLVIYEKFGNDSRVRTFVNIGAPGEVKYKYEPSYEGNFPAMDHYIKLIDYNNDNIPDLFTGMKPTLKLYIGEYKSNALTFKPHLWVEKTAVSGAREWFSTGSNDFLDFADVDGDTDIDVLLFDQSGSSQLHYYKNKRTNSMPKDTVFYHHVTRCWGKFQQKETRREHDLGLKGACNDNLPPYNKPDPAFKTTGGTHGLCILDADGDGDMDILDGFSLTSEVQLLINGRNDLNYPLDTIVAQDTIWQTGGKQLHLNNFPRGFWLDIDDDGDKDLVFSPQEAGSENYRCVHYYQNAGSDAAPNFVFQTDTLFMDNMIDLGEYASPALYDYNRDGKPDLFVGSRGYYRTGLSKRSQISYFKNTSAVNDPSLKEETIDFMNLSSLNLSGAAPAFGDLNADGKDDMVLGKSDGTLIFFQNMSATNNDVPNWSLKSGNIQVAGTDISVGGSAMPFIYDFDKDGDKDLIIGNSFAELEYYENLGPDASGYPKLKFVTDKLGDVHVTNAAVTNGNSCPFIGKIDNTNNEYLLVGNQDGFIHRYKFTPGNTVAPFQKLDSFYSEVSGYGVAAPVVGDLDGNGKYEMIVGTRMGGLLLYEQLFDIGVDPLEKLKNKISLYPNPAQQEVVLSVQGSPLMEDATVRVYDGIGRLVKLQSLKLNQYNIKLDVSSLPQGLYMCTLTNGGERSSGSFIKK